MRLLTRSLNERTYTIRDMDEVRDPDASHLEAIFRRYSDGVPLVTEVKEGRVVHFYDGIAIVVHICKTIFICNRFTDVPDAPFVISGVLRSKTFSRLTSRHHSLDYQLFRQIVSGRGLVESGERTVIIV